MMEEMNQFMEGHIVPQSFRTPGQGGIQGDISLCPVTVPPLAFQPPHLQLWNRHAVGAYQRIDPKKGIFQELPALLLCDLWEQMARFPVHLLQMPEDPTALFP